MFYWLFYSLLLRVMIGISFLLRKLGHDYASVQVLYAADEVKQDYNSDTVKWGVKND